MNLNIKEKLVRLAGAGLLTAATTACGTPDVPKTSFVSSIDGPGRSKITRIAVDRLLIGQQTFWRDTALNVSIQSGIQYIKDKGCEVADISNNYSGPAQITIANGKDCLPELK
ncbi:hypothetical protein M1437_01380 [Patescibacteria group bacterium]|nr:hypothetical protein [Patescibacteria group bacterium]